MGFIDITLGTLKWGVILGYPIKSDLTQGFLEAANLQGFGLWEILL